MAESTLKIGEVAELTGVTVEALRYYERQGLLDAPPRTSSGVRRYPRAIVDRVAFIKQAQRLGLTLRDIQQLAAARRGPSRASCARIRQLLATRIADLDGRMEELRQFRATLAEHLAACDVALDKSGDAECPTVERLTKVAR